VTRHVDELAAHVRRLGNHELNELLLQLPKPRFAALVEVALARPVLPAGVVLRFEPALGVDGWTVSGKSLANGGSGCSGHARGRVLDPA
jgi:hypothetical protein